MPVLTTYPGVYVEEIPSDVHSITGVATSITAFVGRALRGTLNKQTTITSFADYQRIFGGLWSKSAMSFAVRDFFLNGGSQAIIVRVFNDAAPAAAQAPAAGSDVGAQLALQAAQNAAQKITPQGVVEAARALVTGTPNTDEAAVLGAGDTAAKQAGATPEAVFSAMKAAAPSTPSADVTKLLGAAEPAKQVAKAARDAVGKTPTPAADAVVTAAEKVAEAANATPQAVIAAMTSAAASPLAAAPAPATPAPATPAPATPAAATPAPATPAPASAASAPVGAKAQATLGGLTLEAASEGSWGANVFVRVDPLSVTAGLKDVQLQQIAASLNVGAGDVFTLTVHENGGATEVFSNVTVVDSSRRIDKFLASSSNLVRVAGALPAGPPPGTPGKAPTNPIWTTAAAVQLAGGSDGDEISSVQIIADESRKHGIYALADSDLFNLLVIAPPGTDDDYRQNILPDAIAYCQLRRAFMIVDPPAAWQNVQAVTDVAQASPPVAGTASNFAALFFPQLVKPDPTANNQLANFPPSGAVAGVFARTDAQRGVWKAPAGLTATLTGVPALSVPMNDIENGELNILGVNCLRVKPAVGPVVWGARTCEGDNRLTSAWKYIPVRRTALFLEESLYRGTQWVVFEPNDEPLWSQIRLNVGAFMHSQFLLGAFEGTRPTDAYFVKCDAETTLQNDIDNGVVNIIVGFAPLKPAEFVVLQIQQIAGNIET